MSKHLAIRIGILLLGFLLIYVYDHWEVWFSPQNPIGGNSGMSLPMAFVLNLGWIFLWCLFLMIEIIISFFTKNKKYRLANVGLLLLGIVMLAVCALEK